jgi:ActR/RegA family two-component response regulator
MNEENSLLILDDDEIFCKRLQTAMSRKGLTLMELIPLEKLKTYLKSLFQNML